MGLLTTALASLGSRFAASRDVMDERYWGGAGYGSTAGEYVTGETAMKIGAVFQATRVIAETIGSLPFLMYERTGEGGKRRAPEHPLAPVLRGQANEIQTSQEWIEMMTGHAVLRGNGYSEIVSGGRGFVDELIPINPDRVTPERIPGSRRIRYSVNDPDGGFRVLPMERMYHLRGLGSDGYTGMSVLSLARDSFGLAIAEEKHGSRFFTNAARPAGVLSYPGKLEAGAKTDLKREWQEAFSGVNAHKTALLEYGMKWQDLGMSSRDAQFLESRNFQIEDIARWFNVPVHMLMVSRQPTFASIEQYAIEFVRYTLRPWAERWRQRVGLDLVVDSDRFFAEFLLEDLEKGILGDRYAAYAIATGGKAWMAPNEIRDRENLNRSTDEGMDVVAPAPQGAPFVPGGGAPTPDGQQPPRPSSPAPPADEQPADDTAAFNIRRARLISAEAAARVVRKELARIQQQARALADDAAAWRLFIVNFYDEHKTLVAETMQLEPALAELYVEAHRAQLLERGVAALEAWKDTAAGELVRLALGDRADPEAVVTAALLAASSRSMPHVTVNAPVSVTPAPVHVAPAAVTIAAGAVQVEAHHHAPKPPARTVVEKAVTHDAKGRIERVRETHQAEEQEG